MKTGLLEILLSLSSAGSGGDKAANKTQPVQPPAIASATRPEIYSKAQPTVQNEVRRLAKRVVKLMGFDPGGQSGNGP